MGELGTVLGFPLFMVRDAGCPRCDLEMQGWKREGYPTYSCLSRRYTSTFLPSLLSSLSPHDLLSLPPPLLNLPPLILPYTSPLSPRSPSPLTYLCLVVPSPISIAGVYYSVRQCGGHSEWRVGRHEQYLQVAAHERMWTNIFSSIHVFVPNRVPFASGFNLCCCSSCIYILEFLASCLIYYPISVVRPGAGWGLASPLWRLPADLWDMQPACLSRRASARGCVLGMMRAALLREGIYFFRRIINHSK